MNCVNKTYEQLKVRITLREIESKLVQGTFFLCCVLAMVANLEIIKTVSIVAQPSKKYEDFRGKRIAFVAPVRM